MSDSKNLAPYGWYVASYLLRFVELVESGRDDEDRRFLTWENTILVKARSLDEAYDKAVEMAQSKTAPYKGGSEGVDVRWIFEGLTELLPVYEELGDGAEIMWADRGTRKLKTLKRWIRKKGEFNQ